MRYLSETGELTRFSRKYWRFVCLAEAYSPAKRITGVIDAHDIHSYSLKAVGRFSYKPGPPDEWGRTYIIDGYFRFYSERHPELYYNNESNIAPFHHASRIFRKYQDRLASGKAKWQKKIHQQEEDEFRRWSRQISSKGRLLFSNLKFLWRLRDEIAELGAKPSQTISWPAYQTFKEEVRECSPSEKIRQMNAFIDLVFSLQIKAMLRKFNALQKQKSLQP
jgi:hypothetical protein